MKRILTLLLCIVLLFTLPIASAEETPPEFTFRLDGIELPITLSTTPEEAAALLGEHTQYSEETMESIDTFFTIINDSGLRFAGAECMRVVILYYNDELLMISCYMTEDALPDAQPLIDELNLRYGEGVETDLSGDPLPFFAPPADWTWTFAENIRIEYYYDPDAEAFAHMLGFSNNPVIEKMEAAYNALFSGQQTAESAGF